jgi:hypothetical protein
MKLIIPLQKYMLRRFPFRGGGANYLLPPIFASMLNVACGTARKRALSINLPVIDESDLAAGHLAQLLSFHTHTAIFHRHVTGVIIIAAHFIFTGN